MGNSIFSDDRIGLELGDLLREELSEREYDIEFLEGGGFHFIDLVEGRSAVVIVDAIHTEKHPPGEIIRFTPEEFAAASVASPHYWGLPEALSLMKSLGLDVPDVMHILGVEVYDPSTLSLELSEVMAKTVESVAGRVLEELELLLGESDEAV